MYKFNFNQENLPRVHCILSHAWIPLPKLLKADYIVIKPNVLIRPSEAYWLNRATSCSAFAGQDPSGITVEG